MPCVDHPLFMRRLQKACEAALQDARTFPCEETFHRAAGRLDGLLHGSAAVLMSLKLEHADPDLLEDARRIVRGYQEKLASEERD